MVRKRELTFAELIDLLSIIQMKAIFIPENKDAYSGEVLDIMHDLDEIIRKKKIKITAKMIHSIQVVMLSNRYIWENESSARQGKKQDLDKLRITHSINGVRNTAKNVISVEVGERVDLKVDCLAAELDEDLQNWDIYKGNK